MGLPRMWSALLLSLLVSVTAMGNFTAESEPLKKVEEPTIEDLVICADTTPNCVKESCIDVCVRSGEDPMECPLYCNQHASLPAGNHLCSK